MHERSPFATGHLRRTVKAKAPADGQPPGTDGAGGAGAHPVATATQPAEGKVLGDFHSAAQFRGVVFTPTSASTVAVAPTSRDLVAARAAVQLLVQ